MSGFIRFLGTVFLFAWFIMIFFGNEFDEFLQSDFGPYLLDLKNNKWLLLVLGIILSVAGSVTKVKEIVKKNKTKILYKVSDLNEKTNRYGSVGKNKGITDASFNKKIQLIDEVEYKSRKLINNLNGKLKETASNVKWTPLAGGGSNFKTSYLKRINSSRLEVAKSKGGFLFAAIFAILGLAVSVFITQHMIQEEGLSWGILFPILFGGTFTIVGLSMFYWPRPKVFDRQRGWFWAGNKSLAREQDFMKLKQSTRLSEIAAIQVVSERVSGSKGSSYSSWEINLVSDDGERMNVMDHGDKDSIVNDARILGEFLGVPVWDNT